MKPILKSLLIIALTHQAMPIMANDNSDIEKPVNNTTYDLVNNLNSTLKEQLHSNTIPGVKEVSTIQKNQQIIVQIIHDPKICYSNLIEGIAQTASRVNGVNFQNSFTLDIIDSYCKTDLFYIIQSKGLEKDVMVHYEDLSGNNIAIHKINRQLCHI